jgi:transcriptional regulator with XRE-family HTH domain
MLISQQLKQTIRQSGLSLNQISKATGVTNPALSRFLSDNPDQHRDIRLEATADKLAAYFGLSLQPTKAKRK